MPNTASASVRPSPWAMPQSSRVIATCSASACHWARSCGSVAAVSSSRKGSNDLRTLGLWQLLPGLAPAGEEFGVGTFEKLVRIENIENIAALDGVKLFPGDRRGDWGTVAGACRIRHDRRGAALVTQPVEENATLARYLANVGGEAFRLGLGDGAGEALGEIADPGPGSARIERDDDVQSLAAGRHREADEAEVGDQRLQPHGRRADVAEIEPDVGIEVEHQPVGFLQ